MTEDELATLEALLAREAFAGAHLEVGTAAGGTLCRMLACLPDDGGFVVVDRMQYYDDQLASFRQNLERHGIDEARVDLRIASSADAFRAAAARGERFAFALIDAGHGLLDVTRDLRWLRLLAPGGVLLIRDLFRPPTPERALELVGLHAAGETEYQRELFRASLHAAFEPDELRAIAREAGLAGVELVLDSDRHMSLQCRRKPGAGARR